MSILYQIKSALKKYTQNIVQTEHIIVRNMYITHIKINTYVDKCRQQGRYQKEEVVYLYYISKVKEII